MSRPPDTVLMQGAHLSGEFIRGDILDGHFQDDAHSEADIERVMDAMRASVDRALPAGCHWSPGTSEIIGPVDTELDGDIIRAAMNIDALLP